MQNGDKAFPQKKSLHNLITILRTSVFIMLKYISMQNLIKICYVVQELYEHFH